MSARPLARRDERPQIIEAQSAAGRVPPHDLDAEASVLSAVLLENRAMDRVLPMLRPEQFYSDANRRVFEACVALKTDPPRDEHGAPVQLDITTVASWLRDREWINHVGGPSYLVQLVDATPATEHVIAHANIVAEKHRLRQFIGACQQAAAVGYGDIGGTVDQFIGQFEQTVRHLLRSAPGRVQSQNLATIMQTVMARVEDACKRRASGLAPRELIETRFSRMDAKLAGGGLLRGNLYIIGARPGMGKAQPHDAKVLTPTGWKRMGDLVVGDKVIGSNGSPCTVTGVFEQGERTVSRVWFDDGGSTLCCDEHLWLTRTRADRRKHSVGSVKQLAEIRATMQRGGGGLNHSVQFVAPVEFEDPGARPIDPWLLGVFLNNGSYRGGNVLIHNPEQDIRDRIAASIPHTDAVTVQCAVTIRIRKQTNGHRRSATAVALRDLGLSGKLSAERFIPKQYLLAPFDDRVALLQGLCDTDGYVTDARTGIEYTTTSSQLRDDIVFLVQSLGGRVSWQQKTTHYTNNGVVVSGRDAYRMQFSFPRGNLVPVSSKKHLAKYRGGPLRIQERFIKSIERAGIEPCRCIAVDAQDHLYVTDDFIVTHNTALATSLVTQICEPPDSNSDPNFQHVEHSAFFWSGEMPREQLTLRLWCADAGIAFTRAMSGELTPEEWQDFTMFGQALAELPIIIEDKPGITVAELEALVREARAEWERPADTSKQQRERRMSVLVVDYLTLMCGTGKEKSREEVVSGISRDLKELAKRLDIAVVALVQLNRAVEARTVKDKRPQLSDIRESGQIEQDGDLVGFIHRPEYYNPTDDSLRGIAELIIAKQRNAPPGMVFFHFNGPRMRFGTPDATMSATIREIYAQGKP